MHILPCCAAGVGLTTTNTRSANAGSNSWDPATYRRVSEIEAATALSEKGEEDKQGDAQDEVDTTHHLQCVAWPLSADNLAKMHSEQPAQGQGLESLRGRDHMSAHRQTERVRSALHCLMAVLWPDEGIITLQAYEGYGNWGDI